MELHEKILALRKTSEMTQDDFAKALYVSRQSVYKWESGKALPDIEKLKQICELFQVSADELLDVQKNEQTELSSSQQQSTENAIAAGKADQKKTRTYLKCVFALCLVAFSMFAAIIISRWQPAEVREAIALGIVPAERQSKLSGTVSEKDFLYILQKASNLQANVDIPMLTEAVNVATNEQLTREKAAYWLYCIHIWTKIDSDADLSIGTHEQADPITQRDVCQDLNSMSKPTMDVSQQPWEWALCKELEAVGKLFDVYDGTQKMDTEINSILYGPYYTSVVFCLAQKSFLSEKTIFETEDGLFQPKEKLTFQEAVLSVYRLYGSW